MSKVRISVPRGLFSPRSRRAADFVVKAGRALIAIEVKSGRPAEGVPGIAAFAEAFKPKRTLLVGAGGIPVEEFLMRHVAHWTAG